MVSGVDQAVQHPVPNTRQPIQPVSERQREHPARPDLDADLNPRTADRGHSGLAITCTSTRNDLVAAIGSRSTARRDPPRPLRASLRAVRRFTRATVAAPATNPVAATAATCTAGSGPDAPRSIVRT